MFSETDSRPILTPEHFSCSVETLRFRMTSVISHSFQSTHVMSQFHCTFEKRKWFVCLWLCLKWLPTLPNVCNVQGGADQGLPVIVSKVASNTPADLCIPRLNEGDQVLYINGRDISSLTHEQVNCCLSTCIDCFTPVHWLSTVSLSTSPTCLRWSVTWNILS